MSTDTPEGLDWVAYAKKRIHSWRHNAPDKRPKEIRCMEALLTALKPEAVAEAVWRPIDTAPKGDDPEQNGPPILIWREGWPSAYEGFWYAWNSCWFLANLDSEYGNEEYPTHWRPLPAPPAIRAAGSTKGAATSPGTESGRTPVDHDKERGW